jgi:copper(I)-binding protein
VPRLTRRHLPRSRVLPAALLIGALAIPAVTGCEAGLDAPTLAFHPAAGGAYKTVGDVTISNAFILGAPLGQSLPAGGQAGVFVSFSSAGGDQLQSVTAGGAASSVKITGGTVDIPANGTANVNGPAPRIVLTNLSAPLSAGATVGLSFTFANAGEVTLQVPIEPQAYEYATFAQPPVAAASPSPSSTATLAGTHKKKAKASASPTPTP